MYLKYLEKLGEKYDINQDHTAGEVFKTQNKSAE
jgi:hypothetical protein